VLHSEPGASVTRKSIKFATVAVAMAVLAGCAISMPLRPLAASSQLSRRNNLACNAHPKCLHDNSDHRVAYRASQPVNGANVDDDPPDFILNNGDQNGSIR